MSQSKRARKKARQARRGGPRPERPRPQPEPAAAAEPRVARPASRIDRMLDKADARPKPPWHPVPLVEIAVLAGIVLLVIGFLNLETSNGRLAVGVGLVLASLAGLDTAAREHFAGYRSHSSLLAALPAVGSLALLALVGEVPLWLGLVAAAVVFGLVFWLARRAFAKRAGVGFKV